MAATTKQRRHMKKTAKPKAKKQQPEPEVVKDFDRLDHVRQFCPHLIEKRASLLPFDDVIFGESAGPQPGTKYYNPKEEPYFTIDVNDPQYPSLHYSFRVTAHTVEMEHWEAPGNGTEAMIDDPVVIEMEELWNFLRQLPRPASSFVSAYR
jgi:hypothetical protein